MPENRKKLISLLIGHISIAVIHEILIGSTENKEIADHYKKEMENAINLSKKYRVKTNPKNSSFRNKDSKYIKSQIINKVKLELTKRTLKEYKNINLSLMLPITEKHLKKLKVTD